MENGTRGHTRDAASNSARDSRVTCRERCYMSGALALFALTPTPSLEMTKEIRDYLTKQLFIERNIVCFASRALFSVTQQIHAPGHLSVAQPSVQDSCQPSQEVRTCPPCHQVRRKLIVFAANCAPFMQLQNQDPALSTRRTSSAESCLRNTPMVMKWILTTKCYHVKTMGSRFQKSQSH